MACRRLHNTRSRKYVSQHKPQSLKSLSAPCDEIYYDVEIKAELDASSDEFSHEDAGSEVMDCKVVLTDLFPTDVEIKAELDTSSDERVHEELMDDSVTADVTGADDEFGVSAGYYSGVLTNASDVAVQDSDLDWSTSSDRKVRKALSRSYRRNTKTNSTSEEDVGSCLHWDWKQPTSADRRQIPEFTVPTERCCSVDHCVLAKGCSVMDSFNYIFDLDFFDKIVRETNKCESQFANENSRKIDKAIDVSDFKKFLSMIIHMSLVQKPSLDDYFREGSILQTTWARDISLGKNLFNRIFRHLHIANHEQQALQGSPGHDPDYEIRPLFEHLQEKLSIYQAGAHLTLGEVTSAQGFKYPHTSGFIDCICDSQTGIICAMELGHGKADDNVNALVNRLTSRFHHKNHMLYMDRGYSSPSLFQQMLTFGIFCAGYPIEKSRELPEAWRNVDLKRGERFVRICDQVIATKFKDFRNIYMISTIHNDEMILAQDGAIKPTSVVDYYRFKTGVDRLNQTASCYTFARKSTVKWKQRFFQLFHLGVIHAQKYYGICNPQAKLSLEKFMAKVGESLVVISTVVEGHQTPSAGTQTSLHRKGLGPGMHRKGLGPGNHFPTQLISTSDSSKVRTRRCCQCSKKTINGVTTPRRESSWVCMECQVSLCVKCFHPYHRDLPPTL